MHLLISRQLRFYFLGLKHAPHLGDKPWELLREVRMVDGGLGKIQQPFANKVVKGSLKPEPCPDRLGRLALLDPNLMCFAFRHGSFGVNDTPLYSSKIKRN